MLVVIILIPFCHILLLCLYVHMNLCYECGCRKMPMSTGGRRGPPPKTWKGPLTRAAKKKLKKDIRGIKGAAMKEIWTLFASKVLPNSDPPTDAQLLQMADVEHLYEASDPPVDDIEEVPGEESTSESSVDEDVNDEDDEGHEVHCVYWHV